MLYFVKIEVVNLYPFQEAARSLIASEIIAFHRFYDVSWGGQGWWLRVKLRDGLKAGRDWKRKMSFFFFPRPLALRTLTLVDRPWLGHLPKTMRQCQGLRIIMINAGPYWNFRCLDRLHISWVSRTILTSPSQYSKFTQELSLILSGKECVSMTWRHVTFQFYQIDGIYRVGRGYPTIPPKRGVSC